MLVVITAILSCFSLKTKDKNLSVGLGYLVGPDIWTNADPIESVALIVTWRRVNFFSVKAALARIFAKYDTIYCQRRGFR